MIEPTRYIAIPETGCWLWEGAWNRHKYGKHCDGSAHRAMWEHFNGPIPDGLCVLHKCDTPPCCNPNHLFLGTLSENQADAFRKGRNKNPVLHGTRNGRAIVTEDIVRKMRADYANGKRGTELARIYGVSKGCADYIIYRRNWRHVA